MFFITAIHSKENGDTHHRCFGYAVSHMEACQWVFRNDGDMHEFLYQYIVIEDIFPGIHPHPKGETWYRWMANEGWRSCEKPEFSNGVVNWALG